MGWEGGTRRDERGEPGGGEAGTDLGGNSIEKRKESR